MFSIKKIFLPLIFLGSILSAQSLEELIQDENSILLDVRSAEEIVEEDVNGAMNIPINDLNSNIYKIDKTKNIVVFCRSGRRAAEAEKILKAKGFSKVYNAETYTKVKDIKERNILQNIHF